MTASTPHPDSAPSAGADTPAGAVDAAVLPREVVSFLDALALVGPNGLNVDQESAHVMSTMISDMLVARTPEQPARAEALRVALELTGCRDEADLIDMANVGRSLMDSIDLLTRAEGPFKDWTPAEDPAEILFDLVNHYEDDALTASPPSASGDVGLREGGGLKPITVTVYFPKDMAVGPDRARWYIDHALRGYWRTFVHTETDPIRGMARCAPVILSAPPVSDTAGEARDLTCPMCDGKGRTTYEEPCSACKGKGEWVSGALHRALAPGAGVPAPEATFPNFVPAGHAVQPLPADGASGLTAAEHARRLRMWAETSFKGGAAEAMQEAADWIDAARRSPADGAGETPTTGPLTPAEIHSYNTWAKGDATRTTGQAAAGYFAGLRARPGETTGRVEWLDLGPEEISYQLEQGEDGVVAEAHGPEADARREALHYATVYAQDGPVSLFRVSRREWRFEAARAPDPVEGEAKS